MAEDAPKTELSPDRQRLAELERRWAAEFSRQPKLPSEALLTGAFAMAFGFGAVLFYASRWVRPYWWIWAALALATGLLNRFLAARWYRDVVIPWDLDRCATAKEIQELRAKLGE
jgi:hypothetical protein